MAALERDDVRNVTVITEYPEKLNESNWNCGCIGGHTTNPFDDPMHASRLTMVAIDDDWTGYLSKHFAGTHSVVSCLGHRQPGWKHPELISRRLISTRGNARVIDAMAKCDIRRVVAISSIALGGEGRTKRDEWPHWAWSVMSCLFRTFQRRGGDDLRGMEASYVDTDLDYLFVSPVGISKDRVPVGRYYLQVGPLMSAPMAS